MSDNQQQTEILARLETIEAMLKRLDGLGDLLVEAQDVARSRDLHPQTISANKTIVKYNEIGRRKLLLKIEDIPVIKQRRRAK